MNYIKSLVKINDEAAPTGAETVDRLCSRVASSTLLDDRRDAVRALKSLSKKFQLEVGTQALPHLIEVLKNDSSDDDITAYALETLYNLSTIDEEDEDSVSQPEIVSSFIERFTRDSESSIIAIRMIERFEFSVRWPAIRFLCALLKGRPNEVQQLVLTMPLGISMIMDLLADNREVIRNDTLLTLIELTRGNPNIQKIVAFESGFEVIFNIIQEEGFSDGGVIVEDCLMLLLHLLKNNTSNQQFFKEGSLIQRVCPFFETDPDNQWGAQRVANFLLMLKVIRTLVAPTNPSNMTASCQSAMQSYGLLKRLSDFLLSTGLPPDILTETINTMSELIRGCNENQRFFASVMSPWDPPRPAMVVLLMSMVNAQQPFGLRCAVLYCFQCYLYKNPEGQAQVANTLLPTSLEPQELSSGQLLCGGLFAPSDSLSNWLAATALSHVLGLNEETKRQVLRVQLAVQTSGNSPITLLRQISNIAQQTTFVQTRVGLLTLLCSWLTDCPLAVAHFLSNNAAVSFLLSQIAENGTELDFVAQGVCALLLGICIIANDGSVQQYTKESLIELVAARVGIDRFCDALSCVTQCDMYTKALQRHQPFADKPELLLFSHSFAKLFKSLEDLIVKTVSNLEAVKKEEETKAALETHDAIVNQYKELIRVQDLELAKFKKQHETLTTDLATTSQMLSNRDMQIQQLKDQYELLKSTREASLDGAAVMVNGQIDTLNQEILTKESELADCRNTISDLKNQLFSLTEGDAFQSKPDHPALPKDDEATAGLIAEKASMMKELNIAHEQIKALQTEIQRLTDNNLMMNQKINELHKSNQEKESLNLSLQQELAENDEAENSESKEQDDLYVLISDLTEKLRRCKTQLRECGVEVSEDEEDDEDDVEDDNLINEEIPGEDKGDGDGIDKILD